MLSIKGSLLLVGAGGRKKSHDKSRKCIKNQRLHFPTKVHIAKVMVFPAVIYGCELDHKKC